MALGTAFTNCWIEHGWWLAKIRLKIHFYVSKLPVQSSSLLHHNKKSKMADNNVNKASKIFIFAGLFPSLNSATEENHGLERERKVWSDIWANSSFAFRKFTKLLPWRRDGPEIYQGNRKLIRRCIARFPEGERYRRWSWRFQWVYNPVSYTHLTLPTNREV